MVGKSRMASFSSIKGRNWGRINGWKETFLSHAGKEVLMTAVLQAVGISVSYSIKGPLGVISLCGPGEQISCERYFGVFQNTYN